MKPRLKPVRRYTLASPAHSPYGSRSASASSGSAQPAPERRGELRQTEVACEPVLVSAEPFDADDPDRPGPEPALTFEPCGDGGRRLLLQPLQIERAAEPDQARGATGAEPEPAELRGREAGQVGRGRRRMQTVVLGVAARMIVRSICRARLAWISCPATARRSACATVPVLIGLRPRTRRSVSPSSGSAGEAAQELGVVGIEAEGETNVVDAGVALGRDDDRPVGPLRRLHALEAVVDTHGRAVAAVGDDAGRVRGMAPRHAEGVRPQRAELGADGHPPSVGRVQGYSHPMLRRVASRVSMRSRRRKLDLLLELFQPGPETTVIDVGVTDAPFGGGSSDNFFEALYPWPDRITAVGHTELDRFTAAFPEVRAVRADGRDLPFSDGEFDLGFSNAVVEHIAGGRAGQRRFVHELCRVSAQRVRDDAEPLVPARGAHVAAVRALAAGRRRASA